ncbi:hypothetical protein M8998_15925 [Sphingobacterium sp. lm-10]|uniref:hypothetical protein n=1 Tax=Sphingobacterium sp. lm-10 TaxID=2944904 RepID=UPI0020226882|nr:hypothetical protein [Sphingobacterium sp. lm-10]MCL7989439.1 hypothetical protein [Sphingobacterium sp. lm-10]
MTSQKQNKFFSAILAFGLIASFASCSSNNTVEPVQEGIQKAELTFTEVTGAGVYPHGDHFHGLAGATDGTATVVTFNAQGAATANGHLHLDAEAVYRIDLKAWDHTGREVAADFIANEAAAANYKAFLIGGDYILNPTTTNETGAIFQPRETVYGDGAAVTGPAGTGTTGVISYFSAGHDNAEKSRAVTFIMRRLQSGVKGNITRLDWNKNDYASLFAGENVLELQFEIHAEHDH